MDISQPELERLRAQIRDAVVAVLRKRDAVGQPAAGQAASKSVIVLFMGDQMPAAEFFAQVGTLAGQGYRILAALSQSFSQFHGTSILGKLPKGAGLILADNEAQQHDAVRNSEALLAPGLSTNTAAKVALGIEDSVPSRLIRAMLVTGKPVCVGTDMVGHRQLMQDHMPGAPPAVVRIAEDHLHTVQQMGVRFTPGNLAGCVTEILRPEVNDTPERLSRQKPSAKRVFVTAEDVWEATSRGQKEMLVEPGAVVTDQAREYAASRGVVLRER